MWRPQHPAAEPARARGPSLVAGPTGVDLAFAVIDMSPVTHIDAPGTHAMETWLGDFHDSGVQASGQGRGRRCIGEQRARAGLRHST